jgi:hypothetical protein
MELVPTSQTHYIFLKFFLSLAIILVYILDSVAVFFHQSFY